MQGNVKEEVAELNKRSLMQGFGIAAPAAPKSRLGAGVEPLEPL
jgi:hypothetical protein